MNEPFQAIRYMFVHDPAVIVGFLFIGIASFLFMHIQLKMLRLGHKSYTFFRMSPTGKNGWDMPAEYLRIRNKHGWSPWPAYLLWPSLFGGVLALVVGLFRL